MTRLSWDATSERFYETGVDRGVLYVGMNDGVPWTGLTGVSESPTGGEARPYYIDGQKYLNLSSAEEFEATITAFAAPKEFGVCDGVAAIQNGLFATQQPRKAFGMSYRTRIGNDTEGKTHAYKIHLVYNALAGPSERSNTTMADSVEPNTLSWPITTLPPSLTGRKPTAHFVIDSRHTPDGLLAAIENILYGSDAAAARIPTVSELTDLFRSPGPVLRTNLFTDPVAQADSSVWIIRYNGQGTKELITGVDTGIPEITTAMRFTSTASTTNAGGLAIIINHEDFAPAGKAFSTRTLVRVSRAIEMALEFDYFALSGDYVGGYYADEYTLIPANTWSVLSLSVDEGMIPADAHRVSVSITSLHNRTLEIGDTIDVTAVISENRPDAIPDFFYGFTPDTETLSYSFTGPENQSTSELRSWII